MQLPVRMIGFMNGLVYCGISTCSCHVRMTGLMHAVMTVKSDSPSIQWPRFANPGIVVKMTTNTTFDHHAAALETSDCIKRQQFSSLAPHLDQIKGNKLLLKWRQGKRTLFIDTTYGRKKGEQLITLKQNTRASRHWLRTGGKNHRNNFVALNTEESSLQWYYIWHKSRGITVLLMQISTECASAWTEKWENEWQTEGLQAMTPTFLELICAGSCARLVSLVALVASMFMSVSTILTRQVKSNVNSVLLAVIWGGA